MAENERESILTQVTDSRGWTKGPGIVWYLREFEAVNQQLLTPKLRTSHLGWMETQGAWHYVPYSDVVMLAPKGDGDRVMTANVRLGG